MYNPRTPAQRLRSVCLVSPVTIEERRTTIVFSARRELSNRRPQTLYNLRLLFAVALYECPVSVRHRLLASTATASWRNGSRAEPAGSKVAPCRRRRGARHRQGGRQEAGPQG